MAGYRFLVGFGFDIRMSDRGEGANRRIRSASAIGATNVS
jgi:hypothetical protein